MDYIGKAKQFDKILFKFPNFKGVMITVIKHDGTSEELCPCLQNMS